MNEDTPKTNWEQGLKIGDWIKMWGPHDELTWSGTKCAWNVDQSGQIKEREDSWFPPTAHCHYHHTRMSLITSNNSFATTYLIPYTSEVL